MARSHQILIPLQNFTESGHTQFEGEGKRNVEETEKIERKYGAVDVFGLLQKAQFSGRWRRRELKWSRIGDELWQVM